MLRRETIISENGRLEFKHFNGEVEISKEEYAELLKNEIQANLLDAKFAKFRNHRDKAFKAFDAYKSSVVYFGEIESEATRQAIEAWYQDMKDFPDHITATTTLADYPVTPEQIKYYL